MDKGANIDDNNNNGGTLLIDAAGAGQTGVVKLLLDKGANIESKDSYGRTALLRATESHPDVVMPERDGYTGTKNFYGPVVLGWMPNMGVVALLLERGANVNASDSHGFTALHRATYWGNTVVVRQLLEKGASVNAKDNGGSTALSLATAMGHKELGRSPIGERGPRSMSRITRGTPHWTWRPTVRC